mmetsp:Transcript_3037/g.3174  ORF Transcript_3037/g.3174 Transcript_3037/m.3174 type:complete len:1094 (-) Transcript_3037:19-3300(-)
MEPKMADSCNVKVAVRCRPSNIEERKGSQPTVITCDSENKSLKLSVGPAGKKVSKDYTFDKVFGMYSTQQEVFESIVRPIVDETLAGFNCTIFAYGQTGTGKTHTMEGDIHSEEHAGIVPRSVKAILEELEASDSEYTIRVSFLELYNEELQDLLNTSGDRKLKLCEDIKKGVVCQNLEEITVLNVGDIFEILQKGIQQRKTAETLMNKNSSRSHSIFTMKIMIKECNVDGEEVVRHGQLNLVDLAGSECVGRSGAQNQRAREAGSINQSLLTLGRVITALVDHHGHIPYRDSKLTRLLQESLGGKAKTCIIATLSPSQLAVEETMSTLDYAHRAKNIKNQPTVNERMTKKVVLKEYCAAIESLKSQLQLTREKNGVYVDPNEYYAMEARILSQESQLIECENALTVKKDEVKELKTDKDTLNHRLEETEKALQLSDENVGNLKETLFMTRDELHTTQMEWKAAEAVVEAQVLTESTLHVQGGVLQDEVLSRREEIGILLGKVLRLSDSESERIKKSETFVGELDGSKVLLLEGILNMADHSKGQSVLLCEGVGEMLKRGRETCSSLKESIDGALITLIGDTTTAKNSMTQSCTYLQGHLGSTNNQVEMTLRTLQESLSSWLGEVDSSMKDALKHLKSQNSQLDKFSASVTQQATEYEILNKKYINHQEVSIIESSKINKKLGLELQKTFMKYNEENLIREQKSQELIQMKASEMEKNVHRMLQDLVQSSMTCLTDSSAAATSFATAASTASSLGLQELQESTSIASVQSNEINEERFTNIEEFTKMNTTRLDELVVIRQDVDDILIDISVDVGAKKIHLDETVTTLTSAVDVAISQACVAVVDTSETANTILKDVTTATKVMNSSAGEAMDSFIVFMDGKGNEVQEKLTDHFVSLSAHCEDQNKTVEEIGVSSVMYGEEARGAVQVTGNTPKKKSYMSLEELAKTVDHDTIKMTVKKDTSEVSEVPEMTFEKDEGDLVLSVEDKEAVEKSRDLVVNCDVEEEMTEEKESVTRTRLNRTDSVSSLVSVSSCASGVSVGSAGRENLNPNISQKSQLSQKGSVKNTSKIGKVASTRTKANVDTETTTTGIKKIIK